MIEIIGLFLLLAGFIIGLGAVTVIDLHGFLGRKSEYWTEATTRTHKITKPLIWLGIFLVIIGGSIFYRNENFSGIPLYQSILILVLMLNGIFLSFRVSPFLLDRERQGRSSELLPDDWQRKIMLSFLFSFFGWWINLLLLTMYIVKNLNI